MESIIEGAVWGALAGSAGALLGGVLSLIVVPKARRYVMIVCVVGLVRVSRAFTPLQAADALGLEPVSDWIVDWRVTQLQADIDGMPLSERELLSLIRELDPEFYNELMLTSSRAIAESSNSEEAVTLARTRIGEIMNERRPLLNDDEMAALSEVLIAQHQSLAADHNDWCMAMALSGLPGHVTQADLPDEFNRLDMDAYRIVLQSDLEGGPHLDDEALQAFVIPAVQSVYAEHGEDALAVFTYFENPATTYPANACQIFVDYLTVLNEAAGDSRGAMWRTMLATAP